LVNIVKPLLKLFEEPLLRTAAVENTVIKRHKNISIEAALAATLWVGSLTDGLGVITPITGVVRSNPQPSVPLVPNPVTSLEELEPAPAGRERVIPSITGCPTEKARTPNREQFFLIPAELKAS
jgi:hypothetical protein